MKQGVQLNQYGVPGYYTGKVPCRCTAYTACDRRRTINKYPEQYRKWPSCKHCGEPLRVDKGRLKARFDKAVSARESGEKCTCDGIAWQHRKGQRYSDATCNFRHPDKLRQDRLEKLPPEDDIRDFDSW